MCMTLNAHLPGGKLTHTRLLSEVAQLLCEHKAVGKGCGSLRLMHESTDIARLTRNGLTCCTWQCKTHAVCYACQLRSEPQQLC